MSNSNSPAFLTIAEEIGSQKNLSNIEFRAAGAFKETYRVIDNNGSVFALKILNPEKCSIARTEREVNAMKRCDSPFIGKLYEYGQYPCKKDNKTYPFVLEEFFDGGTLAGRLTLSLRFSPELIRSYGISLTRALQETYSLNLVHRDIKPDNIMFRQNTNTPILVDFGLVRDLSATSLTMTWLPHGPGTPYFASPEQLNNQKQLIDWRSDQFSLGIVLSICLIGDHPFSDGSMLQPDIVLAMAQRKRCSNHFVQKASDAGLSNIVKMLEPWPVRRFLTPEDLLNSFKT
jgi:serine/threonine protein kinase